MKEESQEGKVRDFIEMRLARGQVGPDYLVNVNSCGCNSLVRERESQISFPRTSLGSFREMKINNDSQIVKQSAGGVFLTICFALFLIRLFTNGCLVN